METRADIRQFIKNNLILGCRVDDLGDGDSLFDAGVLDSLSVLILFCHLGETYGITPDPSEVSARTFDSIAAIESFILEHRASAASSPLEI